MKKPLGLIVIRNRVHVVGQVIDFPLLIRFMFCTYKKASSLGVQ